MEETAKLHWQVFQALGEVIDPEIGLDIVTLGMVYDIKIEGGKVEVIFTLTTPGCPMEHVIQSGIARAVSGLEGVQEVETTLVWEPRWHPGLVMEGVL